MNFILKDIIKWLTIYLIGLAMLGALLIWYMPKVIEALWIASGLFNG